MLSKFIFPTNHIWSTFPWYVACSCSEKFSSFMCTFDTSSVCVVVVYGIYDRVHLLVISTNSYVLIWVYNWVHDYNSNEVVPIIYYWWLENRSILSWRIHMERKNIIKWLLVENDEMLSSSIVSPFFFCFCIEIT